MTCRSVNHEGFRRLVAYVMKPSKKPVLIHSTLNATDADAMAREMEARSFGRSRCRKRAAHMVFSLADGEHLSFEQWREFDRLFRERFGFDHGLLAGHGDTAHEHAHFIGDRVKLNGRTVSSSYERLRLRQFCRDMEEHFGLIRTPERSAEARISKDEIERADRHHRIGKQATAIPERLAIAVCVKAAFQQAAALKEFEDILRKQGIVTRWRNDDAGRPVGISFGRGDAAISGRHAGLSCRMLTLHYSDHGTFSHEQTRRASLSSGTSALDAPAGEGNRGADSERPAGQYAGLGNHSQPTGGPDRSPSDFLGGDTASTIRRIGDLICQVLSGMAAMCNDMAVDAEKFHREQIRRPRPPVRYIPSAKTNRRDIPR